MKPSPKFAPGPVKDPAGLDQIILAASKGVSRFFEGVISNQLGRPVNFWDGANGLGAVLDEHLKAAGIPNKRLPELVSPRSIVENAIGRPKRRPVRRVR